MESINVYTNLIKQDERSNEKIRSCFFKYCELDTLVMVKY